MEKEEGKARWVCGGGALSGEGKGCNGWANVEILLSEPDCRFKKKTVEMK